MAILSIDSNSKTIKGQSKGFLTGIIYLAPHDIAHKLQGKKGTVCPSATIAGCHNACLYTAGRGRFSNVQNARINRAMLFLSNRNAFMLQLHGEIRKLIKKAHKKGLIPIVRLNGTSDIDYTAIDYTSPDTGITGTVFQHFSELSFYDYTKNVKLYRRKKLPSNYSLTLSYSEANPDYSALCRTVSRETGFPLAIVVRDKDAKANALETIQGAVDGDETDLRPLDPAGTRIVLLTAKGSAKQDATGFVVDSLESLA